MHWLLQLAMLFDFAGFVLWLTGPSETVAPDMKWQKMKPYGNWKLCVGRENVFSMHARSQVHCTLATFCSHIQGGQAMKCCHHLASLITAKHPVSITILKCSHYTKYSGFDKRQKNPQTQPNIPAIFHIPP